MVQSFPAQKMSDIFQYQVSCYIITHHNVIYILGYRKGDNMEMQMIPKHMMQHTNKLRASPKPHCLPRESPVPRQYTQSPAVRQSPLVMNSGYMDNNRQETPISQLQARSLRQTPIDELNR